MNQVTAVQFLTDLAENKIDFNICDLPANENIYDDAVKLKGSLRHVRKVNSKSETEILFGTIASSALNSELPIAVKIFFDTNDREIKGLKYEAKLYKKIYDDIIVPNYSPNFVSYIGYAECNRDDSAYLDEESVRKNFREKYGQVFQDFTTICVLITERVGSGTYFGCRDAINVSLLGQIWGNLSERQSSEIMFQIVYGLVVMGLFRIMHNDLHYMNILVAEFEDPIELGFVVGDKHFMLKTRYIPYLFDWDFGFCESLGDNPKLLTYNNMNIKSRYSEKIDMYTLFCTLFIGMNENSYGQGMSMLKESYTKIPISAEEYRTITSYRPYTRPILVDKPIIYKFGPVQTSEIFRNNPMINREKMTSTIFALPSDEKDMILIYNPYQCRPTSINADFPTPMEFLLSDKFEMFRVDDAFSIDRKYVYVLPNIRAPKHMYIDPTMSIRSRVKMNRMGIKPRFNKIPQSGYVKTKPLREDSDEKSE